MEAKSLELNVRNCQGLKAFNFFQKLSVCAVVSIVSDDPDKRLRNEQKQRTPTDREGNGNPEWNHLMRFDLSGASLDSIGRDHLFLLFDFSSGGLFGGKSIGEVRIPLNQLIDESSGTVRFVSYEIRSSDGKPNGVLNFSYVVEFMGRNYPILHPDKLSHHHHPQNQTLLPNFSLWSSSSDPYSPSTFNPSSSVEPAIHSSPLDTLIPWSTHEPNPIRYPSIDPPIEHHPYAFHQSIYPPPPPLEPFAPLPTQPPWIPYPTPISQDPYGVAATNLYNYSYHVYAESHPQLQRCAVGATSNGWSVQSNNKPFGYNQVLRNSGSREIIWK